VAVEDFSKDLIESVCILQRDGLNLTFTHRSFQEYFSALFITRTPSASLVPLLDQICRRTEDHVMAMAFDMNRNLIEKSWVIPKLRELNAKIDKIDLETDMFDYLECLYGRLRLVFGPPHGVSIFMKTDRAPNAHLLFTLYDLYSSNFGTMRSRFRRERKADVPIVERAIRGLISEGDIRFKEVPELTLRSKRRVRTDSEIPFEREDTLWFRETSHFMYFVNQKKALKKLLSELEQSSAKREAILGKLFQ
jgi:hypothetical protein